MKLPPNATWKQLAPGGIIDEPGTSAEYRTADWRTHIPVIDYAKCIHCLRCWITCPDSAVLVQDGKIVGFDMDHCKGCGICARECPPKVKAIAMVLESSVQGEGS